MHVRFSLRKLFVLTTAVAAVCWGYWVGWPRWQEYRERLDFEASLQQLRRGDLIYEMWGHVDQPTRGMRGAATDAKGNPVGWIQYDWPTAVYLIYCPLERRAGGNPEYDLTTRVEVYRLPPAPHGYEPHTSRGRQALPDRGFAYTRDFFEFLAGDRASNPGFTYERIHIDRAFGDE